MSAPDQVIVSTFNNEDKFGELIQNIENPDPLICFAAANELKGRTELASRLIDIPTGNRVVEHAVREVLGSYPEQSADVLVQALIECSVTGETWHRARRASEYFTFQHQPFAKSLYDLIPGRNIDMERHTIMALGRTGLISLYQSEVKEVLSSDYALQKCYSYALTGAAINFVQTKKEPIDIYMDYASDFLMYMIELPANRPGKYGISNHYILPLGECRLEHVDTILK